MIQEYTLKIEKIKTALRKLTSFDLKKNEGF